MLTLTGIVDAAQVVGGGVNRRTGEIIQERSVVQVRGQDSRGLWQLFTLTVPDLTPFREKIGQQVSVPVRAYVRDGGLTLIYEPK